MEQKLKGQTASVVEFIFGGLLILGGLTSIAMIPLQGIAYVLLGAFLVLTGIQWRLLIKNYKTYMTVLSNDPTGSLTTIAQATNASTTTVKDNLKLMIKKGLAQGMVVDEQGNRVLRDNDVSGNAANVVPSAASSEAPVEMVAAVCSGCGATNQVAKNSTANCEHCGAAIQG